MAKKAMSQSDLAREASKFLPVPKRHKRGAEGAPSRGYKIGRDSISVYCRGEGFPTAPGYLEAIARALDTTAEALTPKIGQTFGNTEPFPEVQMEAASGGKAWLRINKHVSMDVALRILQILGEENNGEKKSGPPEPMRSLGLGDKANPHILRHSRATHLLQDGVSIYDVARLLGDSVQTIERVYGHHSPDYLAEAIKVRRSK